MVFTEISDTKTEFETETCHWEHWSPVLNQLVGEQGSLRFLQAASAGGKQKPDIPRNLQQDSLNKPRSTWVSNSSRKQLPERGPLGFGPIPYGMTLIKGTLQKKNYWTRLRVIVIYVISIKYRRVELNDLRYLKITLSFNKITSRIYRLQPLGVRVSISSVTFQHSYHS